MHSADSRTRPEDLTARARIRDAAITIFGEQGFDASVRVIAERAGVSPALVIHHFTSKQNLRAVADAHVSTLIAEAKAVLLDDQQSGSFLSQLAQMDESSWLTGYLMRSLVAGGDLAHSLFEQVVADTEEYVELGVAAGTLKPSMDSRARARLLAATSLGSLLLMMLLREDEEDTDYAALMRQWETEHMAVTLELYTDGLFTDRSFLETYLTHRGKTADADPGSRGT